MGDIYTILQNATGFKWDEHNSHKNWDKHRVTCSECEQIFFNQPFIVAVDINHSETEDRFFALGKTDIEKKLFVVFTIRKKRIRVISARQMKKKGVMMNMKKNKIPKFKSEDEERSFWASHDSTEYINWSKAKNITLSNLKPSVRNISIRLPEIMISEIKVLANKKDVPYQSLMKVFIAERIKKELNKI